MRDDGSAAAARRRMTLISAGLELFGKNGFSGTTMRAVLRRTGLEARFFTEHFADMDSLLAAVYKQVIDEEAVVLHAAMAATGCSTKDGVRAMLDTLTRWLEEAPGRARIKLREIALAGPECRRQRQAALDTFAALMAESLPPGDDPDRRHICIGLLAASERLLAEWTQGGSQLTRERVVDLVMFLVESVWDRIENGR
ncbi:MAG: TetR/AcrR family transcriptional regulator [Mycobacterium sp.]